MFCKLVELEMYKGHGVHRFTDKADRQADRQISRQTDGRSLELPTPLNCPRFVLCEKLKTRLNRSFHHMKYYVS